MSDAYERPSERETRSALATARLDAGARIRAEDLAFAQGFTEEDFAEALFGETEGCVEVADGCIVETDGRCEHGHRSPMLVLGYI